MKQTTRSLLGALHLRRGNAPGITLLSAVLALLLLSGCSLFLGTESTVEAPTPPPGETTAAPAVAQPNPTPQPGGLVVAAGDALGPISPFVYGSGYGPWVSVPFDLLGAAESSGVTMLRFPGGEFGDRNDLRPTEIDRFITLTRSMGAEPTINARLRGGTPEGAADLVRYVNIEQGYGVTYWAVGNEPNLYPDDYTAEQFVADWRPIAEAMLAVDPTIQLIGPEVSQFTGGDGPGPGDSHVFLDAFLAAHGDLVDVVTVHRYPFGALDGTQAPAEELLASSAEWDRLIPDLRERVRRITGRDIPVGVTEINSYWTHDIFGETTPDSYLSALWLGDVIGRMIGQDVAIMTHFLLTSKDNQGGYGLIGNGTVRPSYYVYQLYQHFGSERLYSASGDELVQLLAARRDDGALTLLAINRNPETAEMPLSLLGHPGGTAELFRMDEARVADGTAGQPAGTAEVRDGGTLTLPGHSMTLFVLP
jgi:hypothetical protein